MPIEVTTVYDKNRMLRYHYASLKSKKGIWVMMAVCTLLVVLGHVFLWQKGLDTDTTGMLLWLLLVWDAAYILSSLLIPRFMIKKSPSLNMQLHYSFREEEVEIHGEAANREESSTIGYGAFVKARNNGGDLYLYVSPRQALIVDISGLSPEQGNALKALLETKLGSSQVKWK